MKQKCSTIRLNHPPSVAAYSAIGGKQEGAGPLGLYFDEIEQDSFCGQHTWEQAESELQRRCLDRALEKSNLTESELSLMLGGDLINQCTATTFALRERHIPFCGIYGACSTMGEALALASLLLDGGHLTRIGCVTSSHFCTAERQYRAPLPYGSQRSPTAQWTATAAGCCLLQDCPGSVRITHVCPGTIVDMGITDTTNMGGAMAPAAVHTISALLQDTKTTPEDYDLILTGDLGQVGHAITADLLLQEGIDLRRNYQDCGLLLYDRKSQDMHAGGSGAGCCAAVLCSWVLPLLESGQMRRVLFAPTGALLSPTSSFQGQSLPGICHGVILEHGVS